MNKAQSIAHNERVNAAADEACRQYYVDNPEGNWEEAWKIAAAIRVDIVSVPSGSFPLAVYRECYEATCPDCIMAQYSTEASRGAAASIAHDTALAWVRYNERSTK